MVCTGCCATLDHIVTYLFKKVTNKGDQFSVINQSLINLRYCRQEVPIEQSQLRRQRLAGGGGQNETGDPPANVTNSLEYHHVRGLQEPVVHVAASSRPHPVK